MSGVKGMRHGSKKDITSFAARMIDHLARNFDRLSPEKQLKIAEQFALKAMPSQINQDVNATTKIIEDQERGQLAEIVREQLRGKAALLSDN